MKKFTVYDLRLSDKEFKNKLKELIGYDSERYGFAVDFSSVLTDMVYCAVKNISFFDSEGARDVYSYHILGNDEITEKLDTEFNKYYNFIRNLVIQKAELENRINTGYFSEHIYKDGIMVLWLE